MALNVLDRWLARRYRTWEARTVDRTASWSRQRRWLLVDLLSCALLCGGGIVGAPLVWIIGQTITASRGATRPGRPRIHKQDLEPRA